MVDTENIGPSDREVKSNIDRIEIESSGKKLIGSGVFITFGEGTHVLNLTHKKTTLSFEFVFKDDNNKENTIMWEPNQHKTALIITCFNFNNALGTSLKEPIIVAEMDNKRIYLNFRISTSSLKHREVVYSFYEGDSNK